MPRKRWAGNGIVPGIIQAIVGPMGSGKTEALYALLQQPVVRRNGVVLCIPKKGNRAGRRIHQSRIGTTYSGPHCLFRNPIELLTKIPPGIKTVGFDEVQFAEENTATAQALVRVVKTLRDRGHNIIWTGLQLDFRNRPFPVTGKLLAISTSIRTFDGYCHVCGASPAPYAQRLQLGHPVPESDPLILADTPENRRAGYSYETRCGACHELPRELTPDLATIRRLIRSKRAHRRKAQKSRSGS